MEEPEIFNIENKATFTVKELKEFSEKYAKKCQSQSKGDITGFWDTCKELFDSKFRNNK